MAEIRRTRQRAPVSADTAEIVAGLGREQKELSPRFFYDEHGSRLFEVITTLDEYYPTRTERVLLEDRIPGWIAAAPPRTLVELGAGSGEKTRIILDAMLATGGAATYVPIDVSAEFLAQSAERLRADYPGLRVLPAVADMTRALNLPGFPRPGLFAFLGSTIGNFDDAAAVALLRRVAGAMDTGDRFLLGADLVKDRDVLEPAYNDARGVTAAFNRNILRVVNRTTGANFDPDDFRHLAFFNPAQSRIEMHLVATRRHTVRIPGAPPVEFREGETIRTEISRKFTRETLRDLCDAAGLVIQDWETDTRNWYGLMTATLAPARRRARLMSQGRLVTPLRDDLRTRAFNLADGPDAPERIGAELELLVMDGDGLPAAIERRTLPFLRSYGLPLGWREERSPKGTPRFRLPGQGTLSFEPGGQLELSTVPGSPSAVIDLLERVIPALREAGEAAGLRLLECGIDPEHSIESAPLQLTADRYVRMARYFAAIGPAGARMMRQTAALHLNCDFGSRNMLRWRVLNAAAPVLTAMFANSRRYARGDSGHASARAMTWRQLDTARTGILPAGPVAEDEYLDFALAAPAMLLDPVEGRYRAFHEVWSEGQATLEQWHEHLSTLFPEVRPRGYLEIRCLDAIPVRHCAAPVVLLAGLLYDPDSLAAGNDLLGSPNRELLIRAAGLGLADPELAGLARDLVAIGLAGAERLPEAMVRGDHREQAAQFFIEHTLAGRAPADFTP